MWVCVDVLAGVCVWVCVDGCAGWGMCVPGQAYRLVGGGVHKAIMELMGRGTNYGDGASVQSALYIHQIDPIKLLIVTLCSYYPAELGLQTLSACSFI